MGITIKDVAAAAGTSVSTVSKVINGHYSISEETAARVRRVMQELNYYPNASAQSFARGTTKTIAVLANLAPNTAFQNPHMFEMIAGLEESLSTRGYRLQLRGVDTATAYEVAKEVIYRQSADALAIHVSVIAYPLSGLLTNRTFLTSCWARRILKARCVGLTTTMCTPEPSQRLIFFHGDTGKLHLSADSITTLGRCIDCKV